MNYRHLLIMAMLVAPWSFAESELPVQSRPIDIYGIKDGYDIAFDNSPLWSHEYIEHPKAPAFVMHTPELYYPPSSVVVRFHKGVKITQGEEYFKEVAMSAIETSAKPYTGQKVTEKDLTPASYRQLKGYSSVYTSTINGVTQDNKVYVTRNADGQLMSMVVSTLPGKLDHIEGASRRIFDNIKFPDAEAGNSKKSK